MPKKRVHLLDIEIDELTNSIKHIATGESFDTVLVPITLKDLAGVRKKKGEWQFNWRKEIRKEDATVYKLTTVDQPDIIQGLVSITDRGDHFYLNLAESAPHNFGPQKQHDGVGGNMFAFCCKLSNDNGQDGIIAFQAKTRLIRHYTDKMGAVHLGNQNMIIYPEEALFLIDKYFKT